MQDQRSKLSVAVIGGGIAGLACARMLADAGHEPRVHDKARRPGGRCSTRRQDGLQFDHGAQFFTVRDPDFANLVASLEDRGLLAAWPGRLAYFQGGRKMELRDDRRRLVARPGMSALPGALAEGLDVVCNCHVAALERVGAAWRLRDEAGRDRGRFDRVVLALPAQQARDLAPPGLREGLDALPMAPTLALMMHLPVGGPLDFEAAFVNDDPTLAWIARDGSKPDRGRPGAWVLHATTPYSAERFDDEDGLIEAEMIGAFEALGGQTTTPDFVQVMRWRFARPGPQSPREAFFARDLGVGACGDWCRGGRIEGAWLSGRAQARLILDAQRS